MEAAILKATESEVEEVLEYFEWQAPDLAVNFMQKVNSEAVLNTRHNVWDIHTNKDRWWVITGGMNLNGVDAAFTLRFGRTFSLYNAASYKLAKYQSDNSSTASGIGAATDTCIGGYLVVGGVVPTCGKQLPGTPKWMNKTVATLSIEPFETQVIGDYVGSRFSTFTNDSSVPSYFLTSLRLAARLPDNIVPLQKLELALNVTNLGGKKGVATISVGSATNSYSA